MNGTELFNFCFGCLPSEISGTVIITPFLPLGKFKEYLKPDGDFSGRLYSGFTSGEVTVIRSGIGDRLLGDAVLLLREAKAKKILFVGTCGGLNDCAIGDILVVTAAFNGEGFSKYHTPGFSIANEIASGELIKGDPGYAKDLSGFLADRMDPTKELRSGAVFTIGSLMAEHERNLVHLAKAGFLGVEMELSAVYRAAAVGGIPAAGLVAVSDLPLTKGPGENITSREKNALNETIESIVRFSSGFAEE